MAMIQCPECGKDLSSEATVCPHCGYPIKKSQKKVEKTNHKKSVKKPLLFVLISAIVIIACVVVAIVIQPSHYEIALPYELDVPQTYDEALRVMANHGFKARSDQNTVFGYQNETDYAPNNNVLGLEAERTCLVWEPSLKGVFFEFVEQNAPGAEILSDTEPKSTFMKLKTELVRRHGEPTTQNAPTSFTWKRGKYEIVLTAYNSLSGVENAHTVNYIYRK